MARAKGGKIFDARATGKLLFQTNKQHRREADLDSLGLGLRRDLALDNLGGSCALLVDLLGRRVGLGRRRALARLRSLSRGLCIYQARTK